MDRQALLEQLDRLKRRRSVGREIVDELETALRQCQSAADVQILRDHVMLSVGSRVLLDYLHSLVEQSTGAFPTPFFPKTPLSPSADADSGSDSATTPRVFAPPVVSGEHGDVVFSLTSAGSASETADPAVALDIEEMQCIDFLAFEAERFSRRYRVLEIVGNGTFGQVFRAHDRYLQRDVALKRLNVGGHRGASERAQRLFRYSLILEARIGAQLVHPNLVPIHDFGLDPQNNPYLVMRFLSGGKTLRTILKARAKGKSAAPRDHLLRVLARACDGLGYAHMRGVVHRDVKPDNIYVAEFDDVTVLDWGVARVLNNSAIDIATMSTDVDDEFAGSALSSSGIGEQKSLFRGCVGTVPYMAPEQVDRRIEAIDARTDIWAVGVILYEVLTGERPFADTNPYRLQVAISHGEYTAPSARVERMWRHRGPSPDAMWVPDRVPPELDRIVARCLARDSDERYARIGDLKADIDAFLSHRPLDGASAAEVARKWAARNFAGVVGIAAMILATLSVVTIATWFYISAVKKESSRARNAEAEAKWHAEAAIAERRRAEIRHAEGLLAQARALGAADQWPQARAVFTDAGRLFEALDLDVVPVQMGLWETARMAPLPIHTFGNVTAQPRFLAISADNRVALKASVAGTVSAWDTRTAAKLDTVATSAHSITCLAISPDSRVAVTGDANGTVRTWPIHASSAPATPAAAPTEASSSWAAHVGPIAAARLSSDGRWLVTGGEDGTVRVWDMRDGTDAFSFRGESAPITVVAISDDGHSVAAATADRRVVRWNRPSIEHPSEARPETMFLREAPTALAFSRDGGTLVVAAQWRVHVWERQHNHIASEFRAGAGPLFALGFSADGRWLIGMSRRGIQVWEWPTGRLERVQFTETIETAVIAPDGNYVLAAAANRQIQLFATMPTGPFRPMRGHTETVTALAFSADSRLLVGGAADGAVGVWDVATGHRLAAFRAPGAVCAVDVSPDGATVFAAGTDAGFGTLHRRFVRSFALHSNARSPESALIFDDSAVTIPRHAFAPDGRYVFVERDGIGQLRDRFSGAIVREFRPAATPTTATPRATMMTTTMASDAENGRIVAVAFSPDMRAVVTRDDDGAVRRWDMATSVGTEIFSAGNGNGSAVAFSGDGQKILASDESFAIRVMGDGANGAANGEWRGALVGHVAPVTAVVAAPGSSRALSLARDGTVIGWDVNRSSRVHVFLPAESFHTSIALSPTAAVAAVGGASGTLDVWDFSFLGRYEALRLAFLEARVRLAADPTDAVAWAAVGDWLMLQGALGLALDCYERARHYGDSSRVASLTIARGHWGLGDFRAAAEAFSHAQSRREAPPAYLDLCRRAATTPRR